MSSKTTPKKKGSLADQIKEYVDAQAGVTFSPSNRRWFKDRGGEIYLRIAQRIDRYNEFVTCIDIANVCAKRPGKGWFKALLVALKQAANKHSMCIYVENVHDERFQQFLFRNGFEEDDNNGALKCYILDSPAFQFDNEIRLLGYVADKTDGREGQIEMILSARNVKPISIKSAGYKAQEVLEYNRGIPLNEMYVFTFQARNRDGEGITLLNFEPYVHG